MVLLYRWWVAYLASVQTYDKCLYGFIFVEIGFNAGSSHMVLFVIVFSNRSLSSVNGVYVLGNYRTRLETRTKESSMCASHWDFIKPKGVMKVNINKFI